MESPPWTVSTARALAMSDLPGQPSPTFPFSRLGLTEGERWRLVQLESQVHRAGRCGFCLGKPGRPTQEALVPGLTGRPELTEKPFDGVDKSTRQVDLGPGEFGVTPPRCHPVHSMPLRHPHPTPGMPLLHSFLLCPSKGLCGKKRGGSNGINGVIQRLSRNWWWAAFQGGEGATWKVSGVGWNLV